MTGYWIDKHYLQLIDFLTVLKIITVSLFLFFTSTRNNQDKCCAVTSVMVCFVVSRKANVC